MEKIIEYSIVFLSFCSGLMTFKLPLPEPWASLRPGTLQLLLISFMWICKMLVNGYMKFKISGIVHPLIGLICVSIISFGFNLAIGQNLSIEFAVGQIVLIILPVLTLLLTINSVRDKKNAKSVFNASFISSWIVSLIGVINHVLEHEPFWITNRLKSTLQYGALGSYLMIFLSLAFAQLVYSTSHKEKMRYFAGCLILGFALYASFVRAAWVGTAVSIMLILILRYRRSIPWRTTLTWLIMVILGVSTSSLWVPFVKRTLQIFDPRNEGYYVLSRIPGWVEGLHVFLSHWWLGTGPGSQPQVSFAPEVKYNPILGITVPVIHNNYLEIAYGLGIMGLMFLIWLVIAMWTKTLRIAKRARDRFLKGLSVGLLGAITGLSCEMMARDALIHCVWNVGFYSFSASFYVWLMLGLIIAIDSMREEGKLRT
jgi:cell division protein FtsW (lipid II flippase)